MLTRDAWKEFTATLLEEQQRAAGDLNRAYDSGHISRDDFVQEIVALTDTAPEFVEDTVGLARQDKNLPLLTYIKELHGRYKLGILSNIASDWITDELLTAEELELFDTVITSHEVGLTKPDPNIFRLAADRLEVEPGECLMIDDSMQHCEGARRAGMQAVQYSNFMSLRAALDQLGVSV